MPSSWVAALRKETDIMNTEVDRMLIWRAQSTIQGIQGLIKTPGTCDFVAVMSTVLLKSGREGNVMLVKLSARSRTRSWFCNLTVFGRGQHDILFANQITRVIICHLWCAFIMFL